MKTVEIRAPFYGAGSPKQFGWVKDGYDIFGIGLKLEDLLTNQWLIIKIKNDSFLLDVKEAKAFVKRYKSFYKAKNDTMLGVFSKSLLMPKGDLEGGETWK